MAKSATIDILGTGGLKHTAVYEEGSVRKFELMKEDYVRLVFHTNERFAVSLGDYIVTEWGTFYITKPQKPVFNTSTGGYDYDLQFDAPHYRWNNRLYKFEPNTNRNEASWSLTDNLRNQMAVFLRNLENLGFEYTVDPASYEYESASNNVYLVFENCYLLDALTKIAEAFGLEWWITDNIIHIGKCSKGTPVDFTIGVNVEDMGSEKSSKEYYTRLYAFGSTQNVPVGYRKNDEQVLLNGVVQKRIMMPTVDENGKAVPPYVEVEGVESEDEVVEAIVIFDDVKPKTDNKVTDLKADRREVEKTDTVEAGNGEGASVDSETETVTIYRFKDESLKFSEKFVLPGVQLQAQFQSGALNGMTFDLAFNPDAVPEKKTVEGEEVWNEDAQWFEIVRNETYGVMLPNDTLKPARNDKFIILGWDVRYIEEGMELVTKAEQELRARALKKVEEMQLDNNVYPCTMMADYMYGLDNKGNQDPTKSKVGTFPLGQKVRLNNDNFFVGGSRVSRVVGYEYKLDIPYDHAIIYVGEACTYSSKAAQQAQINEVLDTINYRGGEYSGMGIGGSGIYVITTNDKTAPTDSNVYSAMKSEKSFARKDVNDTVSALWTFTRGNGARRGIQSKDYSESGANEDNLFGKGFELVERTNEHGDTRSRLEVDELFVRVKAFFSSLEIREMSYLGGNYAFSSAGGKIYYVEWLDALDNILTKTAANLGSVAKFRCYLYSDDGTTATVNKWRVDDQAMCRTFNIDEGVHEGTSNKYYWRRIIAIGKGVIANAVGTESEATEYQYVDISNMTATDYDVASDYPEEEDTIVQMGNWSDPARQGLILLKVEGEDSPAIIEYSGIGANGNHFVLPEPTLQLSPKRNIIYGEFHSVVNSSTGGEGSGETIDDQLRALLDALNDIKQQADQKFDIWFGNGIPLPNVSRPTATANYPASEWTTPELKALHAQDLFYDQDREPAKNGGRAWRWVAYDNNGQVGYYWQEVTDADTLAALEQISDVASDGKLTGGAEKTRVFIEWRKAVEDWSEYMERAEDYGITTERGDLNDAFKALGKLLNGGTDLVIGEGNTVETPLWLTDLTTTTVIPSAENYRNAWNRYYSCLSILLQTITAKAKELADNAQETADNAVKSLEAIASDNKIDKTEIADIKHEFIAMLHEFWDEGGLKDQACDSKGWRIAESVADACYDAEDAMKAIGKFLNGGTNWTYISIWGENPDADTVVYSLDWEQTLANLPLYLKSTYEFTEPITIDGDAFVTLWGTYYKCRASILGILADVAHKAANDADQKAQDALDDISDLADDDILTEFEKLTVLREWDAITREKADLIEKAKMAHVSSEMYELRYNVLGNYLNNPTASAGRDITTPFTGTPEALTTSGNTTISGWQFKQNWSNFYAERTALLSAISTSKTSYYVGVDLPSTPYYAGDIWMKLSSATDTRGVMMLCIRDNETETADERDWLNMTDQLRDPLTILAKVANLMWVFMGGYIKERGNIVLFVTNGTPQGPSKGDVWYKPSNSNVNQYTDDGWESVSRSDISSLVGMLYAENGDHNYCIYSSPVSNRARKYDMCVRNITFTEPMSGKTVEGNLEIQAFIGGNWIVLQDSTKAMIENYANQINSYMFGSENGYIKASGIITRTNITEMFAQVNDPNSGEIVTKSYINVFTKDFVTEDGMKSYISGVKIGADQIELTGTDKISMLVKNSMSNAVGPNLISNSLIGETSTAYGFAKRSVRLEKNQKYTLSANGLVPLATSNNNMELRVYIWRFVDQTDVNADSTKRLGVDWINTATFAIQYNNGNAQTGSVVLTTDRECEYHICAYLYYKGGTGSAGDRTQPVTLNWLKLEKGELATEWVPGSNDEVLWKNYIVNPRAVDGTFATDGSCSKVTDPTFGEVVNISHEGNSNWQLRFTAGNGYKSLVGKTVTFYVICKNDSGYEPHTGDNRKQLRFGGGDENVSALDTTNAPFVDLGNGWRKYYSTRTIKTGLMSNNAGTDTKIIGINCVMGNWKVYTVGVVLGGTCPTTQEIMNQSGLIATGIDIQNRSIELRADKVKFTSSDGKVSNKIWIDPTTGTLNATDGNFSGKFRSYNPTTWNEINIDAYSGALVMKGPNAVQDDNRDLPHEGATQTELFRLEFQTDPDTLRRVANMRLNGLGTYASIDGIDGFYFGEGYGEGKRHFSIDLYGISYVDADGHYYSMSWEGLLRKIS